MVVNGHRANDKLKLKKREIIYYENIKINKKFDQPTMNIKNNIKY